MPPCHHLCTAIGVLFVNNVMQPSEPSPDRVRQHALGYVLSLPKIELRLNIYHFNPLRPHPTSILTLADLHTLRFNNGIRAGLGFWLVRVGVRIPSRRHGTSILIFTATLRRRWPVFGEDLDKNQRKKMSWNPNPRDKGGRSYPVRHAGSMVALAVDVKNGEGSRPPPLSITVGRKPRILIIATGSLVLIVNVGSGKRTSCHRRSSVCLTGSGRSEDPPKGAAAVATPPWHLLHRRLQPLSLSVTRLRPGVEMD
jgi:hypothetical protein